MSVVVGRRAHRRESPAALLNHALTLIARSHGGELEVEHAARSELQSWRGTSAAHEAAATQAQLRWQAAGGVAEQLREVSAANEPGPAVHPAGDDGDVASARAALRVRRRGERLRTVIAGAGTAAVLLLAVWVGRWAWLLPTLEHTYAAARGQQLQGVALPDGTRLDLDADTRIAVVYTRQQRETRLVQGQVRFDVAREPERAFTVHTRSGTVRVLGTAFTVSDRGGAVRVVVERGQVRVEAGGRQVDMVANQGVRIDGGATGSDAPQLSSLQAADGANAAAWLKGWLIFDGVPLAEATAQFNAYLLQPITVAPAVAGLRLTGNFRTNDPQGFLRALPQVLPVKVNWGGAGLAERPASIEPR